ncbi:MAG: sigma 54-interacting transcriptional regulator [Deltaproteobacteria bacterium]|nr:sigma 54-interacting transcriptional regulator [Deltaproteobacteria bacterium]MBZ0219173.1 sigma-54 dependent transcriptional regulator [Deltaproteobacteria bacterium]
MMKPRLLVLDDDETFRGQMKWAFCRDYEVFEAGSRGEALLAASERSIPVGVMDLGLPPSPFEPSEGMRAIREILSANPLFKAVILTGVDERDNAFRALDLGAFDYFTKPVSIEEVRMTIKRAYHAHDYQSGRSGSAEGAGWPCDLIGLCRPMQEVFHTVRKLAEVNIPALIIGEPGTGKETVARAVHRLGSRHALPFLAADCKGAPERVLEAEVFGSGLPPGQRRKSLLELADGGTVFLKEVGSLSLRLQARLLDVLREHSIEMPSTGERASVDVRVISSSDRDLRTLARSGEFNEDLAFRVGIITLVVPPLRERGEDIHLLSLYFLKKYAREYNRPADGFERTAIDDMKEYRWPGNVRELENRVRRAVIFSAKKEITSADLGLCSRSSGGHMPVNPMGLAEARDAFRKRMIQDALVRNEGSVSRAAAELGISRQYLSKLIIKYKLRSV